MPSSQFLCYRELIGPSSIRRSTFLSICTDPAIGRYDDFLVTIAASALCVYRVYAKSLKKLTSMDLNGKPQDLAPIPLSVTFADGKTIVEVLHTSSSPSLPFSPLSFPSFPFHSISSHPIPSPSLPFLPFPFPFLPSPPLISSPPLSSPPFSCLCFSTKLTLLTYSFRRITSY